MNTCIPAHSYSYIVFWKESWCHPIFWCRNSTSLVLSALFNPKEDNKRWWQCVCGESQQQDIPKAMWLAQKKKTRQALYFVDIIQVNLSLLKTNLKQKLPSRDFVGFGHPYSLRSLSARSRRGSSPPEPQREKNEGQNRAGTPCSLRNSPASASSSGSRRCATALSPPDNLRGGSWKGRKRREAAASLWRTRGSHTTPALTGTARRSGESRRRGG